MRWSARANWSRFWKPPALPRRRFPQSSLFNISAATAMRRHGPGRNRRPARIRRGRYRIRARRRPARAAGTLPPRRLGGRGALAADLSLRRDHAALLHQAASAYIKIAEGCDHPCTFCVIPNLRGKFRSRRFESVVAEAAATGRARRGGDHAHRPGHHLLRRRPGHQGRPRHAARCLARIEGLRWLRFLYAYPNRITGRLLDTIASHDNICKYLDVPLQHASPQVLKA